MDEADIFKQYVPPNTAHILKTRSFLVAWKLLNINLFPFWWVTWHKEGQVYEDHWYKEVQKKKNVLPAETLRKFPTTVQWPEKSCVAIATKRWQELLHLL